MSIEPDLAAEGPTERDARIRDAQNAVIARMKTDLDKARSTITTTGRVEQGLACVARQGKFEAVMDFGPGMGGDKRGPSPGFFGRAAIAGCVAMAVKMHAARHGLVFRSVEVSVETDFDDAALFGLTPQSAAPLETRIEIAIDTDEPEAEVNALVESSLEMDPWFMALRDPQKVVPKLTIRTP